MGWHVCGEAEYQQVAEPSLASRNMAIRGVRGFLYIQYRSSPVAISNVYPELKNSPLDRQEAEHSVDVAKSESNSSSRRTSG